MSTTDHIRWGLRILLRTLQIFVIWPSSFVGAMIFVLGLTDGAPFVVLVQDVYQWGEAAFRGAQPGMVMIQVPVAEGFGVPTIEPPIFNAHQYQQVPVRQAIENTAAVIAHWYLMCVWVTGAAMLVLLGPRRFIGLYPVAPLTTEPPSN